MNLSAIQRQVENAVDDAYRAGFEAALDALRTWAETLVSSDDDPTCGADPCYIDGVDDAIITVEQAR
jgi:hypothetical protein